ncbi:MAG: hypothetical protein NC924_03005 [Candidatus Omnitrophica bacterium]|nr:hypothetical protein [Candidatus Omnitrophota bacterium]
MIPILQRTVLSEALLHQFLVEQAAQLMPGIAVIDTDFGDAAHMVKILAADARGAVSVIHYTTQADSDFLLVSGLAQLHWVRQQRALLKRLYPAQRFDEGLSPALVLVAPVFSAAAQAAAGYIAGASVRLVRYQYFLHGQAPVILLDEIFSEGGRKVGGDAAQPGGQTAGAAPAAAVGDQLPSGAAPEELDEPQAIALSPEEIAEFMEFDRARLKKKSPPDR